MAAQAAERLTEALCSSPLDAPSLCNLGFLHTVCGRDDAALRCHMVNVRANATHVRALYYAAQQARKYECVRTAVMLYERAVQASRERHANAIKDLGARGLRGRPFAGAQTDARSCPAAAAMYMSQRYARCDFRLRDVVQARRRELIDAVSRADPDNPKVIIVRARSLAHATSRSRGGAPP